MGGGGMLSLLRIEQVQKELNLIDDQKTQLNEVAQKASSGMRDLFSGMRDLDPAARDAKKAEARRQMQQRNAEAEKEAEKILLPQQFERLKGIYIQVSGPATAVVDPAIANDLGLTADQKANVEKIQNAVREVMRQGFAGAGGQDASPEQRRAQFAQMREKMTAAQKEADQRVLGLLTPEQQQKLEQMKGPRFELDMSQMRRPGGPPPAP